VLQRLARGRPTTRTSGCRTCRGHEFARVVVELGPDVEDGSGDDLRGPVTIVERCGTCSEQHQATYYLEGIDDQPVG